MSLSRSLRPVKALLLLTAVCLCLGGTGAAFAQEAPAGSVILGSPDTSQFPQISLTLEAYDDQGLFISDLLPRQVTIMENGRPLSLDALDRVEPGVQFIVAYNIGPTLANRYTGGTRFAMLQQALIDWAGTLPQTLSDRFSLVANSGVQAIGLSGPRNWIKALSEFTPDLIQSTPNLTSISQALDLATDPVNAANMKRAILYITPPPGEGQLSAIPNIAARVQQLGVRVFVWMVAPASYAATPAGEALRALAEDSGGQFAVYSGAEAVPDVEAYLHPLRSVYMARYTSVIALGGEQRIFAQIERPDVVASSSDVIFSLQVLPPTPIFLLPPDRVERAWVASPVDQSLILTPDSAPIGIMVEFPDGHPRELVASRLYVNDQLAAENRQPPFERLTWPLVDAAESGEYRLKVTIEDSQGLQASTIEMPVQVVVEPRPLTFWEKVAQFFSGPRLIVILAVAGAAAVLVAVMVLVNRAANARRPAPARLRDPLTQPVEIRQEAPRSPSSLERPSWPRGATGQPAPARLVRLADDAPRPAGSPVIPLLHRETSFGRNPGQASVVLDSPSVNDLHARLRHNPDGSFTISDAGSIAGTWVNYAPVSRHGVTLEHGDLIHIGKVAFRFEMARPTTTRQPRVHRLEDDE